MSGNGSPTREVKNSRVPGPPPTIDKQTSQQKQKLVAHSTAMESIQAQVEPIDDQEHVP
jgi:hypothetical protein